MKCNLENFPRFKGDIAQYFAEVIPWKIGFEKGLRDLRITAQSPAIVATTTTIIELRQIQEIVGKAVDYIYSEILGEDSE